MKNLSKYLAAPEPFVERTLTRKVVADDGCWHYSGSRTRDGYAQANYKVNGKQFAVYPHVLAYLRAHGEIPVGYQVDHACHDPETCSGPCMHRRCINPAHLKAMPARENNRRSGSPTGRNARKIECPRGHEYDVATPSSGRRCSECEREKARRQYKTHGAKANAKRAERMKTDAEYREKRLAMGRARASSDERKAKLRERYATDPEYRELVKARVAERYQRKKAG